MNKKQFFLVIITAIFASVAAQAVLVSAVSSTTPTTATVSSAGTQQNIEDLVFDTVWKKMFHYITFFEGLQGFNVLGNISVDGSQLLFVAGGKDSPVAEITKTPSWQGLVTFSQRERFRTAFTMTTTNNTEAYISVGRHDSQSYGFKIVNTNIYGYVNDGKRETLVFLQKISSETYGIEARYKPNEIVVFYVNSLEKGEIVKGLPSALAVPNYTLMDISFRTTDTFQKSFQVSFFEYLQTRNVLK